MRAAYDLSRGGLRFIVQVQVVTNTAHGDWCFGPVRPERDETGPSTTRHPIPDTHVRMLCAPPPGIPAELISTDHTSLVLLLVWSSSKQK
eukprot:1341543-Prymnesium_polylepis.2